QPERLEKGGGAVRILPARNRLEPGADVERIGAEPRRGGGIGGIEAAGDEAALELGPAGDPRPVERPPGAARTGIEQHSVGAGPGADGAGADRRSGPDLGLRGDEGATGVHLLVAVKLDGMEAE